MANEASSPKNITIVIYTDSPVLAHGLCGLLSSARTFKVLLAQTEISRLVPLASDIQPELILMDLNPDVTLGLLSALHTSAPGTRMILWGGKVSEELMAHSRELGVVGFVHRALSPEEFLLDLGKIAAGGEVFDAPGPARCTKVDLTPRESQLIALLVQGLRNKEIGSCLGITEGTVRIYLSRLFLKVGARDRLELAVFGMKNALCGQASWDGQNAFVTDSDEGRALPVLRSLLLIKPARRQAYAGLARAAAL
jgi:DNA-binding NarL/FixJ family response regulator